MTRDEVLKLVNDWTQNKNLVKHMLAVEAQMRALAKYFNEDEDLWGMAGLVHDADYEMLTKEKKLEEHPMRTVKKLKELKAAPEVIKAVEAHTYKWNKKSPEPASNMQWALYTCDELSGFIIAVALVRPDKKLASLKVESIQKKWPQKSFAAGVHRDQIELSKEKLGIELKEFIQICLTALQGISDELGL